MDNLFSSLSLFNTQIGRPILRVDTNTNTHSYMYQQYNGTSNQCFYGSIYGWRNTSLLGQRKEHKVPYSDIIHTHVGADSCDMLMTICRTKLGGRDVLYAYCILLFQSYNRKAQPLHQILCIKMEKIEIAPCSFQSFNLESDNYYCWEKSKTWLT